MYVHYNTCMHICTYMLYNSNNNNDDISEHVIVPIFWKIMLISLQ